MARPTFFTNGRIMIGLLGGAVLALSVFVCGSCSEKKQPPERQNPRVVMPIKKSERHKITPKENKRAPRAEKAPEMAAAKEIVVNGSEKKESEKSIPDDQGQNKKNNEVSVPEAGVPTESPKTQLVEKKTEKPDIPAEKSGHYTVKNGDSLRTVASRPEIYGDEIKWPALLRNNPVVLDTLNLTEDSIENELPKGVVLRFITPEERIKNLSRQKERFWAINIVSEKNVKRLTVPATRLIKEGHYAYIARATIKNEQWYRLRVGFFPNRQAAADAGKEIESALNRKGVWLVKITEAELESNGGY